MIELIVVGGSLGSLPVVQAVLGALPPGLPAAVAVVQHREAGQDDTLATVLGASSALPVAEAEDKLPIEPGRVYVAPSDYHLLVEPGHFALSTEAPVSRARPSVDVLFESAAEAYGPRVVGVVLTGASADGAEGLAAIARHGGAAVVQDPETAEARVMPEAAIRAVTDRGGRCAVLAVPAIAPFLAEAARPRGPARG